MPDVPGLDEETTDPTPPAGTPAAPVAESPQAAAARRPSTLRTVVEWVAVIGGALVVALLIRTFLLAAFYIPSKSMVGTLQEGDRVLVNKLSYRLHDVRRGDVVVFENPANASGSDDGADLPDGQIKDLIKRVVGLSGETVEGRNCLVYVTPAGSTEQFVLDEPYTDGRCTSDFGPVAIPEDHVWVMGDNRPDSQDSRWFGPIDEDLIVGRAFVRVWPLTHLGWL